MVEVVEEVVVCVYVCVYMHTCACTWWHVLMLVHLETRDFYYSSPPYFSTEFLTSPELTDPTRPSCR